MHKRTRSRGLNNSSISYPKGTRKGPLCREGNRLPYEFCAKHNVPHRHTGKLVVATDAHEATELTALKKRGEDNGVEELRIIGPVKIHARHPYIKGAATPAIPPPPIHPPEQLLPAHAPM